MRIYILLSAGSDTEFIIICIVTQFIIVHWKKIQTENQTAFVVGTLPVSCIWRRSRLPGLSTYIDVSKKGKTFPLGIRPGLLFLLSFRMSGIYFSCINISCPFYDMIHFTYCSVIGPCSSFRACSTQYLAQGLASSLALAIDLPVPSQMP